MSDFDDERARGRAAILKRRAKLVAYAVAAGVAVPACGGKSNCLSVAVDDGGRGGAATMGGTYACLTTAGRGFCLTAPAGASFGGYGGTSLCLGMPYAGETYCLSGGEGPGGRGGGAGEGGAGGDPPIFCLSAPLGGAPPVDGTGGADDGGVGGTG